MAEKDLEQKIGVKKTDRLGGWQGFLGLVSFSTILPINIHTSIQEMAKFTWLWPLIGGFIGIIVGGFAWLLVDLFHLPSLFSAALIYSLAISFTGFHHLDGLVDFGDGIMAHGNSERKIEIMRDKRIGTGGLGALLTVSLITFAAIASIPGLYIFAAILLSEVAAKLGLVTCATFSEPLDDGTGRFFIEHMNWKFLLASLVFSLILGFLTLKLTGIIGVIAALAAGSSMTLISRRNFRWATGDVLGASNEISRMTSLIVLVMLIAWGI
jgi:adenosylcobinamide-GDP ribazoletransferase